MNPGLDCPCGSTATYGACCGPVHDGRPAETAEALMRSRYAPTRWASTTTSSGAGTRALAPTQC